MGGRRIFPQQLAQLVAVQSAGQRRREQDQVRRRDPAAGPPPRRRRRRRGFRSRGVSASRPCQRGRRIGCPRPERFFRTPVAGRGPPSRERRPARPASRRGRVGRQSWHGSIQGGTGQGVFGVDRQHLFEARGGVGGRFRDVRQPHPCQFVVRFGGHDQTQQHRARGFFPERAAVTPSWRRAAWAADRACSLEGFRVSTHSRAAKASCVDSATLASHSQADSFVGSNSTACRSARAPAPCPRPWPGRRRASRGPTFPLATRRSSQRPAPDVTSGDPAT